MHGGLVKEVCDFPHSPFIPLNHIPLNHIPLNMLPLTPSERMTVLKCTEIMVDVSVNFG